MSRWLPRPAFAAVFLVAALLAACGEVQRHDPEAEDASVALDQPEEQPELRQAAPRERPPSGSVEERVEDAMLETRVLLALAQDEHVRDYSFDVQARSGTVYVRGDVASHFHAERVEAVAQEVDGVSAVVNEIVSEEAPPSPAAADTQQTDEEFLAGENTSTQEAPAEEPAEEASEPAQTFHTVRSGESLWTIARRYDTSVDALRRLNNMQSDGLRPGQRLRVR